MQSVQGVLGLWGIAQCEQQIMLTWRITVLGWMIWDEGVSMRSVEEDGDAAQEPGITCIEM